MVDYQRQLLDELMGRNRNLDPGQKAKEKTWKDSDNCKFFMVRREKPGKGLKVEYLIKKLDGYEVERQVCYVAVEVEGFCLSRYNKFMFYAASQVPLNHFLSNFKNRSCKP